MIKAVVAYTDCNINQVFIALLFYRTLPVVVDLENSLIHCSAVVAETGRGRKEPFAMDKAG